MTSTSWAGSRASESARRTADSRGAKYLGRAGLVAYGVVTLLIAYLAIKVATGGSDRSADKSGALSTVAAQPAGGLLLWVIAVALAALTLWEVGTAAWGFSYVQDGKQRLRRRLTHAGQAIVVGVLAFSAGKTAVGASTGGTGDAETFTTRLLELRLGQVLVALAGIAMVAIAGMVVHRGLTKRFTEDQDFSGASPRTRKATVRLGQIGYSALGSAYAIIGILIVAAAVTYDPQKAAGLDDALKTLSGQPYGVFLLWLIALGLICYGVYSFFDARFRRG